MRLSLLSFLALGLALPAAAQTTYGVRAGLNVSDYLGVDEDDVDAGDLSPSLGFVGGVFAEVPLSPRLSLRPEVLYSQKGFSVSMSNVFEEGQLDFDFDVNVDYVEVPVLARIGVPLSPTLDAGLLLGPAVAFKVRESLDGEGRLNGEIIDDLDFGTDGEDAFETVDLGLVLGAEVGSGPFYVDLRYTLGLLNVANDLGEGEDTPRNGVFSVAGTFKLGR